MKAHGITPEEHDAVVAAAGRPYTQDPIRRRTTPAEAPDDGETIVDTYLKAVM